MKKFKRHINPRYFLAETADRDGEVNFTLDNPEPKHSHIVDIEDGPEKEDAWWLEQADDILKDAAELYDDMDDEGKEALTQNFEMYAKRWREEQGTEAEDGENLKFDIELEEKKDWIQSAVNPKHKGYCTPMTKKTCTPQRKALAKRFKKAGKKEKKEGGTGWEGKV